MSHPNTSSTSKPGHHRVMLWLVALALAILIAAAVVVTVLSHSSGITFNRTATPPVAVAGQPYPRYSFCTPLQLTNPCGGPSDPATNPTGGKNNPYHFALEAESGTLPPGLTLQPNGLVTGTVSPQDQTQTVYGFHVCVTAPHISGAPCPYYYIAVYPDTPAGKAAAATINSGKTPATTSPPPTSTTTTNPESKYAPKITASISIALCDNVAPHHTGGWVNCPATATLALTVPVTSGEVSVTVAYPVPGSLYKGEQATAGGSTTKLVTVAVPLINSYVPTCLNGPYATTINVYDGPTSDSSAPLLTSVPVTIQTSGCPSSH